VKNGADSKWNNAHNQSQIGNLPQLMLFIHPPRCLHGSKDFSAENSEKKLRAQKSSGSADLLRKTAGIQPMSFFIFTPAPEARHNLAQPVRAGNSRQEGTERRRCDTRPFHSRMSTKPSHPINGATGVGASAPTFSRLLKYSFSSGGGGFSPHVNPRE